MPRSIATSNAPSDAGAPSQALVPALATSTSDIPRSIATLRASASAIGLRQVLPVHTKRIFTSADQTRYAFSQNIRGDRAGTDDSRSSSGAIDDCRGLRRRQSPAIQHTEYAARDRIRPLADDF